MAVVNMSVGATTHDGATFAVKVDTGPVRVLVADNPSMSGGVFFGPVTVDANGAAKVSATGLAPHTRYWWQVEDNSTLDTSVTGQFITLPTPGLPASFRFGVSACAGSDPTFPGEGSVLAPSRLSNSPIFDVIRQRALAEQWLGFAHLGDLHYYDLGSGVVGTGTLDDYRRAYDDVLAQPNQHRLYREVPWWYVWDDHDYGPNDSDGTLATKANAAAVYRERIPHYPLSDASGVWQAWQIGRVLCVMSDVRYYRSPNTDTDNSSKTMLGAAQKAWLENLLETSTARLLIWLMPDQWLRTDTPSDTWAAFATERAELIQLLGDTGWLGRMVMINGDRHALGLDRGSNQFGGFPVLLAASLDSSFGAPMSGVYDTGPDHPGREQYGTVDVEDFGAAIRVTLTGWIRTSLWQQHQVTFLTGTPSVTSATVQEFAPVVSGSHQVVVEARILTSFQTGDDPDGISLPILDGDVQFDATADVFATFELTTSGVDEATGRGLFPRRGRDMLAPFGNEVFIRRGVDIGHQILWSGLGYFRIESVEQDGTADAPIRLAGRDRMGGIIDARLLQPLEFPPTAAVGTVVAQLVGGAHPLAGVVFDDDTPFATLGRTLVVEDDRYAALKEIADSFGKIMFWDGDGLLRFETAPDESKPVWEVRAGRGGVLITSARRMTREGVFNAVVAYGEAGETDTPPVRGVAFDLGPNSPTNWNGRFGRVPRFYSSPLIRTTEQATSAARAILSRSLGAPYSVDFTAVPNPALRPWHPVRVTQSDGNREVHVIQTLTIPLVADGQMPATTREKTTVVIGVLT